MSELEIFLAAAEIADPQARNAYLDQACAGYPALRQQVEALLKVHHSAEDFLATPAVQQLAAKTTAIDGKNFAAGEGTPDYEKTHAATQGAGGSHALSLEFLTPSDQPKSLGRLGHYEVHEVIGQGAFGIVLKAFDEKLHRMVAIKVLSPELAKTSPPRKRFLREARAAAAVRHEHVVAIYAVEEQPIPYLVMEYIPGITLEQALNDHGPLDVPDVLRLGQQIAAGLAAAHGQGLIHRDIKPSNILLENGLSGRVKISDFGLARAADDASLTQSGTIAGTPLYMSPEQATTGKIDQRSDQFSLGSVLYVMVSGRPPFRAPNTLAVLKRVVDDMPRSISEIVPDVPGWLCAIISKLHAKQPNDRFATAQDVADLLGRCLSDLQNNRPVRLPEGVQLAEEKSVAAVEPVGRRSASEDFHPLTPVPPHPRTSSRRAWPTIAAAALFALIGLGVTEATGVTQLTSTVIRLTTGSGTLVIETDDPGVKVTIDGEEVQIQGAGVEQLTLKPGQYKVAAMKDGIAVSQELVTITRGGKQVVRVTLEGIASVDPPVSRDATRSAVSADDADRRAAEYVLSIGGEIYIPENGIKRQINLLADLPRGAFQLTDVNLLDNQRVSDEGLACFQDCRNVTFLWLRSPHVTDAGLASFRNCKKLSHLRLSGMPLITDAGMAHFEGCNKLQFLELDGNIKITHTGLTTFRDCKDMVTLHLNHTSVTDDDLSLFQNCKQLIIFSCAASALTNDGMSAFFRTHQNLNTLDLRATQLTDAGLEQLADCPQLAVIDITRTKVTAAGVQKLAAALPRCHIEWNGGVIEPTMSDDPERRAAEYALSIGGVLEVQANDVWSQRITAKNDLPAGAFQSVWINLNGNRRVTDDGLAIFENCRRVAGLTLRSTNISDAGLAHFRNCRELTFLRLSDMPNITDAGLASVGGCKTLEFLELDSNLQITSAGLRHFQNCEKLATLYLTHTNTTDADLEIFQNCKLLTTVSLHNTKATNQGISALLRDQTQLTLVRLGATALSDEGLETLAMCRQLKDVSLIKTQVTETGVKKLAAALPRCRIEWDGGLIEPRLTPDGWHGLPADAPPPAISPFDADQAKQHQEAWAKYLGVPVEYTNSIGMKFRLIPPGEFLMGSTQEEIDEALKLVPEGDQPWRVAVESEGPQHRVVLTQPVYQGMHEVTQSQYETVMGRNPSHFSKSGQFVDRVARSDTANYPVEGVTWNDAIEFCAKLSRREQLQPFSFQLQNGEEVRIEGAGYHLPSEAQWEFACRAGTTTKYWSGDKDNDLYRAGWFWRNSDNRTHAVGELRANPFGLFDTHGNVWELTLDYWDPNTFRDVHGTMAVNPAGPSSVHSSRVVRGGDQHDTATVCRAAHRDGVDAKISTYMWGFRANLTVDAVKQAVAKSPLSADPDRTAAAWALSAGIPVEIAIGNDKRMVQPGAELPQEPFELRYADLRNPTVTDEGLVHFAGCRHIVSLHLTGKAITDAGVENFRACKKLTALSLEGTAVTDHGLAHFTGCRGITHLTLDRSPVSDTGLAVFQECHELRWLYLHQTQVTDAGLAHFGNCPQLEQLGLAQTQVTDAGLANFKNCRNLTALNLSHTRGVTDAGMDNFRRCRELTGLILDGTKVTDVGLANFRDCRKLGQLRLDNLAVSDAGLANFPNCPDLTTLSLHSTKITDEGLASFSQCKKLQSLFLENTAVTDAGLAHFQDCEQLMLVGLARTGVSDAGLSSLRKCKNLQQLSLAETQISDAGLVALDACPELTGLNLAKTKVTDAGLKSLSNLEKLTDLNFQETAVTDAGLDALKPLVHLTLVNLRKTDVTSAGIDALQQALPKCKLDW